MKKIALVLAIVALISGIVFRGNVGANESASSGYCVPPNTQGTPGPSYSPIAQGQVVNAPPLVQALNHAELCGGNYGDVYTDGSFYDPSFTFSGSSYTFTIPANVFVALGQRVFTVAAPETAPPSTTTYYWLDCPQTCNQAENEGTWEQSSSSSPPDSSASLDYIVVSNGSGITGVTFVPETTFLLAGPQATPSPTASTGINISGSWPYSVGINMSNGQVTCSLASTASCNGTTTIISGSTCTAVYDHAATTISPLTDLLPLQLAVSTTTLTVYMDTSASLTGTLAADILCLHT
jgi:hypothetical protein